MSLIKSAARRRLALFTGSSMAAAGIAAAASMGAMLLPTSAAAQACAGTTVSGPQLNSVTCVDGDTVVTQTLGNQGTGALTVNLASGDLIFNLDGRVSGTTSNAPPHRGGLTVTGAGNATVNLDRAYINQLLGGSRYADLFGTVNLSGLAGETTLNVNEYGAFWVGSGTTTAPTVILSQGDSIININAGGVMYTQPTSQSTSGAGNLGLWTGPQTVNFNTGDNTLNNHGLILVGPHQVEGSLTAGAYDQAAQNKAELRLLNLGTFNNYGDIHLGVGVRQSNASSLDPATMGIDPNFASVTGEWRVAVYPERNVNGTDRSKDDILSLPGATFVGHEGSRIYLDIDLGDTSGHQTRCDATIRNAQGFLPSADCLNIQNGATEGVTSLVITNVGTGGASGYNPAGIVIVDMSDGAGGPGSGAGGTPGNFVFDPSMRFYSPAFGGTLDSGMFMYQMLYNEDLMQFSLVGVPSAGAHHQPLIANGAQQAWRSANAGFFDRQVELRDTIRVGERRTSGAWMRFNHDQGERTTQQTFSVPAGDVTYDNTHDLDISSLTVGADFLGSQDGDDYWVLGGMLGYVRTDIGYANWTDTVQMNGMLVGGYASLLFGPLFVDAQASGIWTRMDQEIPQAELYEDRGVAADIETLGAQVEAGWRYDLGFMRLEPLASLSWVRTSVDDTKIPEPDPLAPGNLIQFEDANSTRAGVGLRGSTTVTSPLGMMSIFSVTGRYSKELDGKASAAIGNANPITPVVLDEFDGNFGEVILGYSVADESGRLSGGLNVGTRFGDDYESITASAGFRYQW